MLNWQHYVFGYADSFAWISKYHWNNGDVTVRAPRDCEKAEIDDLIRDRREWIEEKRAEFLAQKRECEKKQEQFPKITPESEREFRRLAKEKIPKMEELFFSS